MTSIIITYFAVLLRPVTRTLKDGNILLKNNAKNALQNSIFGVQNFVQWVTLRNSCVNLRIHKLQWVSARLPLMHLRLIYARNAWFFGTTSAKDSTLGIYKNCVMRIRIFLRQDLSKQSLMA